MCDSFEQRAATTEPRPHLGTVQTERDERRADEEQQRTHGVQRLMPVPGVIAQRGLEGSSARQDRRSYHGNQDPAHVCVQWGDMDALGHVSNTVSGVS